MKSWIRIIAGILLAVLVLSLIGPALAAQLDPDVKCELNIDYRYDSVPIPGAAFRLYIVGKVTETGEMVLTGAYEGYDVELNVSSESEFQEAAEKLYNYIRRDELLHDHELITDENGQAGILGLPQGIWLLVGDPVEVEGGIYRTKPQFVILPYREDDQAPWQTCVTVIPKCEFDRFQEEPIELKVLKKWDDKGYENKRPAAITIYLMKDGKIYDTVVLTKENNWRHSWTDLDPNSQWSVVEDVPVGYSVTITREGITFLVKNSYDEPPSDPTKPTEPDDEPDIPQTGMLWWPVPVLILLGAALILLGVGIRKGDPDHA